MRRAAALGVAFALTLAAGCRGETAEETMGTVLVASPIEGAELFVDAEPRGELRDGLLLELPPGVHWLEARRGRRVLASERVRVFAGDRVTGTLYESRH